MSATASLSASDWIADGPRLTMHAHNGYRQILDSCHIDDIYLNAPLQVSSTGQWIGCQHVAAAAKKAWDALAPVEIGAPMTQLEPEA
jgi:hypothetical protein